MPHGPICLIATARIGSRRIKSRRAFSYPSGVRLAARKLVVISGARSRVIFRALRTAYDSKSYAICVGVGRHLVPVRAPEHRHIVVHPRSTTDDAHVA